MKEITALVLQTWFDIADQYSGSTSNAFAIAKANNVSMTDDVVSGQIVVIPDGLDLQNKEIFFFSSKKILPATGITDEAINDIETAGIGAMIIETNFIVR